MLRLVATDLDGTLLHTDGTVTDRTREVLDELDRRGVTVVFVTGRPIRWMESLWPHVGGHGIAICSNGGIVYDVHRRAVVEARPIPRDVGLAVAERVRAAAPGTTFSLECATGFAKEATYRPSPEDEARDDLRIGPLEDVFGDDVVKLLALDTAAEAQEYWRTVEEAAGDVVVATWSGTFGALVEMSALGVTKASTLAMLCEERGIAPEEVVAFGDMPNDVAMLRWAGTSYAMADAHPSVLAAADRVAPPHDEDGVAQVLEELFLGGVPA